MRSRINGKSEEFVISKILLSDYLSQKGIQPQTVAVEINLNIVDKNLYDQTYIQEGDEVEIVKFVGGG
jgi:thiamine biosynthesis protein ThiS